MSLKKPVEIFRSGLKPTTAKWLQAFRKFDPRIGTASIVVVRNYDKRRGCEMWTWVEIGRASCRERVYGLV